MVKIAIFVIHSTVFARHFACFYNTFILQKKFAFRNMQCKWQRITVLNLICTDLKSVQNSLTDEQTL